MPPGGGPPALHAHESEEIYRVERGTLDDRTSRTTRGELERAHGRAR